MKRSSTSLSGTLLPITVMLVAVVGLAACGSDSKTSTKRHGVHDGHAAASTTAVVVIKTADTASLGKILVDASGKTVYTLTKGGAAVACTGGCLTVWPPVLLPAGGTTGDTGVKVLSVVDGAGGKQVTSDGPPALRSRATPPRGRNGDGLSAGFGGVLARSGQGRRRLRTTTDGDPRRVLGQIGSALGTVPHERRVR